MDRVMLHDRQVRKKQPRVVSLFSGCGGLDLGFKWKGFDLVYSSDILADAVRTYRHNVDERAQQADIRNIDPHDLPECDVIVGGPPCQAFSLVGKRDPEDPRASLVEQYLDIIRVKHPKVFVMENVLGLRSAKDPSGRPVLQWLVDSFTALGYSVNTFILNAADYGVPQRRRRIFVTGSTTGRPVAAPTATHADPQDEPGSLFTARLPWVTSGNALSDLSEPSTDSDIGYYVSPCNCDFQRFARQTGLTEYTNHRMPYMSAKDLQIIAAVPPGGNYTNVPDDIATKRILHFKQTGGRTTTYGRLDPDRPSYTLNSYFSRPNVGCNIHYQQDRLITVREGLRLQSFPDSFAVLATSVRSEYIQVGNAVPPLLAASIAEEVLKVVG